jgi:hypothetical protein
VRWAANPLWPTLSLQGLRSLAHCYTIQAGMARWFRVGQLLRAADGWPLGVIKVELTAIRGIYLRGWDPNGYCLRLGSWVSA